MPTRDTVKLLQSPGPFVSVYLDSSGADADGAKLRELRWREARDTLSAAGADAATLDAVEAALPTGDEGHGFVCFAANGAVAQRMVLPEAFAADLVDCGPVPRITPLLAWLQTRLPHLVVLVDRTGADISAYYDEARPTVTTAVQGTHDEIRRVAAGGWSQQRYQHRAEDSWEHNAKEVADTVTRLVRDLRVGLVVVSGDVRAVQLLCEALPKEVSAIVRETERGGGRAADGSHDIVVEEVARLVHETVSQQTTALLEEFEEERGQHDRAADGVAAVVDSLMLAQVQTLLICESTLQSADGRTAWFGEQAGQIGLDRETLTGLGCAQPQEAPLVDVLVREALATGADVRFLPGSGAAAPAEGVGALLRYAKTELAT